jgi:alpha-glucosidase
VSNILRFFVLLIGLLVAICGSAAVVRGADDVVVESPNGDVRLTLRVAGGDDAPQFAVTYKGRAAIEPSVVDVQLAEVGSIAAGAVIKDVARRDIDEKSELPWGKTSHIHNHCRSATVRLTSKQGIEWNLELRAFDDGAALRYGFPEQEEIKKVSITDEDIEFQLAGDPSVMFTICDHFTTSHEALYERQPLAELPAKKLFDKPLLAVWPGEMAAAITEAGLRNFAGMYLERADKNGSVLRTRLSPLPDKKGLLVEADAPVWSPWRVVLLAAEAGQLIENDVLLCLNEPPDGDFDWVKPGKTAFHWWNGTVENGPPSTPETNFAIHKRYIDFCAQHGIEYHSVISVAGNRPWFVQREPGFAAPHPDTDILTARRDIDLPRILDYAKEKGVGIRFWVHWKPLSEHLEEAFAQYEKWGIRGLMVDFMDRDDQEMIEWQEKCLRAAAKHKLHIQFHGSHKPTGEERTFPNLFNREGVLNLEYSKWSDLCSPPHAVNVAYTRLLAGPVDYHLGGFRAAGREKFEPRDLNPLLMGTRCHQLALYVVYDNPMPMVADDPAAYEGQAGFDFVAEVPTTWDETRFVMGDAGEYIVVARRSGDTWYLGGITNWSVRNLAIPTKFLGEGEYDVTLYVDRTENGKNPNGLKEDRRRVRAGDSLGATLESGGGVAAVFRPK